VTALTPFDPLVREWFAAEFPTVTDPQRLGWPEIQAGRDVLISAPTGSGKTLAADLTLHNIAPENLFAARMPRGQEYSLSFYLHREIDTWITDPKAGYLLSTLRSCQELVGAQWNCSTPPLYLERSGYLLYRVSPSQ